MKDLIQQDEDRYPWMREHSAWTRLNRRRVDAINRGDKVIPREVGWCGVEDSEPITVTCVNLTPIRHRLAPPVKLSAMEEARRQDRAVWVKVWLAALAIVAVIVALAPVAAEVVLWMVRML
jgi:hypothetical protein